MKHYTSRRKAKKWFGKEWVDKLDQFGHLKLGDLIASCSGFNARISRVEVYTRRMTRKHRVTEEIQFIDEHGRSHWLSGHG